MHPFRLSQPCPVCGSAMATRGSASISFPSGTSDLVMTYRCDNCRIEMTETLKTSAAPSKSTIPAHEAQLA